LIPKQHSKYNYLKLFHFYEKLEAVKKGILTPPIHVRLKPTNICNHNCYYCSYRSSNLSLGEDMNIRDSLSYDKMVELINDLADMGIKAVTLSGGGEPLCYKYITELLERLYSVGIKVGINTNGSLIKGNIAQIVAKTCSWVRISIDGWDNKSYSEYRSCGKDEYDNLMNNIRNLSELTTNCTVGANVIVDKKNYLFLEKLINDLRQAGISLVKVSECIVSNDGVTNNKYHEPIFKEVKRIINELIDRYKDSDFSIVDKYHDLPLKFQKEYYRCLVVNFLVVIGADGVVYSCHDKAYTKKGTIGSIKKISFKELWQSPETLQIIRSINPSKDCMHHCAEDMKNRLLHDFISTDPEHLEFV